MNQKQKERLRQQREELTDLAKLFGLNIQPKTNDWEPPTDLPKNWRILDRNQDRGVYKSRDGLTVIVSCCIESDGKHWVHLSVSRKKQMPSWAEFNRVKGIFLGEEALAVQVFAPRTEWVNDHDYCLHLYQCLDERPVPDFRKLGTI